MEAKNKTAKEDVNINKKVESNISYNKYYLCNKCRCLFIVYNGDKECRCGADKAIESGISS